MPEASNGNIHTEKTFCPRSKEFPFQRMDLILTECSVVNCADAPEPPAPGNSDEQRAISQQRSAIQATKLSLDNAIGLHHISRPWPPEATPQKPEAERCFHSHRLTRNRAGFPLFVCGYKPLSTNEKQTVKNSPAG